MAIIEITAGGKEGAFRGEPGVYTGTLIAHEVVGPFDSKQPKYPGEQYSLNDWTFSIDGADEGEELIWFSSSLGTGPRTKTFALFTALFGGEAPPVGTKIDVDKHLIGRQCLLDIRRNDKGYLNVEGVMPLPKAAKPGRAAAAAPAVAGQVADSSLPF